MSETLSEKWTWRLCEIGSEKLEIALTATVLKLQLSNLAHLSFRHWRTSPQNLGQFGQLFYFPPIVGYKVR